jgi:hypothetical protein
MIIDKILSVIVLMISIDSVDNFTLSLTIEYISMAVTIIIIVIIDIDIVISI